MRQPTLIVSGAIRRYPVQIVVCTMVVALALSFGIPRLQFETGQDTLIDPGSQVAQDNTRFQREFGGDYLLVLFETPAGTSITTLFSAGNVAELRRLQDDLNATGDYESIITPLLILELAQTQIETRMQEEPARLAEAQNAAAEEARAEAAARGASSDEQGAAEDAARQRVADEFNDRFGADARRFLAIQGPHELENPSFVEFVMYGADGELRPELSGIFPDERHALMVARPRGNLSIDEGSEIAAELVEQAETYRFEGVTALVSGPTLLIKEINDQMKSALAIMAVFAVVIMTAVLFFVFRARWRLLSLPTVLVGCISAFGLMGFLGIPLTMVTISGLPILIGLGVDFAVQVHSRIEEETNATESAEAGIDRTAMLLAPALAIAAAAAVMGFLVLHLSEVPMIRDFGSMLAVGAVIVFIMSIALIASIVYLRERTRIGPRGDARAQIPVEGIVGGLTSRTVGRLAPIALLAVLIALGGFYAGRKITTQTDPERFVSEGSSVLKDLYYVRDVTGSTSELNLLVEIDGGGVGENATATVVDDDVLAWMMAYEDGLLRDYPELRRSNSIASLTRSLTGAEPTEESATRAIDAAPEALVRSVVSEDLRMASMTFAISGAESLDERRALTEAIERAADPPAGVTVAPAGIAVVGTESVVALQANRDLMSFVALAAIFTLLLALFRNPVKALVPLLPVILALGASAMILYASGIEYSPLTSISGPLIIAMGTEFSVLLMARYFEERASGLDARAAMSTASRRIGRAIMASGLTVMGGFAVLAFSGFPLLDNFGKVTALNIGISLLSTLILLPPLLVWADEERGLVRIAARPANE